MLRPTQRHCCLGRITLIPEGGKDRPHAEREQPREQRGRPNNPRHGITIKGESRVSCLKDGNRVPSEGQYQTQPCHLSSARHAGRQPKPVPGKNHKKGPHSQRPKRKAAGQHYLKPFQSRSQAQDAKQDIDPHQAVYAVSGHTFYRSCSCFLSMNTPSAWLDTTITPLLKYG